MLAITLRSSPNTVITMMSHAERLRAAKRMTSVP
jgi:hypothetical protein